MLINDFFTCYLLLITGYFFLFFGYLHYSHKPDVLNNLLSFGALFFVFLHVLLFLSYMYQHPSSRILLIPLWCMILSFPIILIGLLIIISSIILFLYRVIKKDRDINALEEKWTAKMEKLSKARRDTYRKISHVLIFIGLFIVWYIGYTVVTTSMDDWVGMIPDNNNTLELYIKLLTEPGTISLYLYHLGWFYYLIFFFFYAFCLFLLTNEITRKNRFLAFPFNRLPKLVMSEEEKQNYGTYLYFAVGQMFAAFLCPPMPFFAILGMSSIADLMTSQIGIRWGKHHIKWNSNKTWEGTIAGTITSIILCYIFVGIVWATIFTVAFFLFDVITNKPLKVSDNLLIPIGCALIYIFVRYFFDLNYISPLLQLF